MSFRAAAWVLDQRVGDPTLKMLLLVIAQYADENGHSWPSQSTLAYDTEISERTIRRRLAELQTLGLIEVKPRSREDGGQSSNRIILIGYQPGGQSDHPPRSPESPPPVDTTVTTPSERSVERPKESKSKKTGKVQYSEDFETTIWQPYPRKNGTSKKAAFQKYDRLDDPDKALLRAAIPIYAEQKRGKEEEFIQHLEFFISKRTFETVQPSARSGPPRPGDARPEMSRDAWEKLLKIYKSTSNWKPQWGPEPGKPGCLAPADLIESILGDRAA